MRQSSTVVKWLSMEWSIFHQWSFCECRLSGDSSLILLHLLDKVRQQWGGGNSIEGEECGEEAVEEVNLVAMVLVKP